MPRKVGGEGGGISPVWGDGAFMCSTFNAYNSAVEDPDLLQPIRCIYPPPRLPLSLSLSHTHTHTKVPDTSAVEFFVDCQWIPISSVIPDEAWLSLSSSSEDGLVEAVRTRGAAVLGARKLSSAMSAANATAEHLSDWLSRSKSGESTKHTCEISSGVGWTWLKRDWLYVAGNKWVRALDCSGMAGWRRFALRTHSVNQCYNSTAGLLCSSLSRPPPTFSTSSYHKPLYLWRTPPPPYTINVLFGVNAPPPPSYDKSLYSWRTPPPHYHQPQYPEDNAPSKRLLILHIHTFFSEL